MPRTNDERTLTMTTRMSVAERKMLEKLAAEVGLSASDIIRQLVRREYAEKFGSKATKSAL